MNSSSFSDSTLSILSTKFPHVRDVSQHATAQGAVEQLQQIYNRSAKLIQNAFDQITQAGEADLTTLGSACYPFAGFYIPPEKASRRRHEAYGVIIRPGAYGSALTQPHLLGDYYTEQLDLILKSHDVPIFVGLSDVPMPLPFVVDQTKMAPNFKELEKLRQAFVFPDLRRISDHLADCVEPADQDPLPLSLFSAERVDFSLQRLRHYTGTHPKYMQRYILLTNYQFYVDTFVAWAKEQLQANPKYLYLVEPGNVITPSPHHPWEGEQGVPPKMLPQMPAYHLVEQGGTGISLVNIGVGPSNAKTITDHLAVLRPYAWIMIGHCGGLRDSQQLGDYVLAHGYLRLDNVLNDNLPQWISIPPLAEVQNALQQAVMTVTGLEGEDFKAHVRTGTVATTDNRNWELLVMELMARLRQSRSIAVDMESATIAANGFRFRVPYGTLLCVSDKPVHGEIKLPGLAQSFYRESINQHLFIGLEAMRLIRELPDADLHSRKLRGFDEPPFR